MIARFHYDDDTLGRLLDDSSDQHELAAHVETCLQCQERLETITQDGLTWQEAGELLRKSPPSDAEDGIRVNPTTSFLKTSEHPDSLGRFGRYEIMEFLGRGGMGIVMRGYDPALNRHSAVKVLAPELASSAAARKRFSREAKSAAAVVHPHVVPIQTVDEQDGLPYLVMPVVEGQSLQQRVDRDGPLPIIEVVRIAMQIADGLSAAHAQGLVHRDIKPANILLENGVERVQITDFGLARAADDASMTRSGVIAGTPQYMSPEQAHGDQIDHRSDLFSLGSVIFFMCTGHSPFRAETTMGVLHRIVSDAPRPIRSITPDLPIWLESIIHRLLEKQADGRFHSADEVAHLLGRWLAHLQQPDNVDPPEPAISERRWVPPPIAKWLVAAGGLMAFAAATVFIVVELDKGTLTIKSPSADVPIRISQGEKIVRRMTVKQGENSTRIAAGQYIIEIEGGAGDLSIADNKVTLTARGEDTVVITQASGNVTRQVDGMLVPALKQPANKRVFNNSDMDVEQLGTTVQVVFKGPKGLLVQTMQEISKPGVTVLTSANAYVDHGPCPSRWNLATSPNHYRRLNLTDIPGYDELRIQPIMMLRPASATTKSWLNQNAIPIEFTTEDFDHVLSGNRVTKVIYMPDPEFVNPAISGLETLVSTRLDPGVNPRAEADRRGEIIAIMEMEDYDRHQTASYQGMPLAEAVRNLNTYLSRRPHFQPQPPLTVDEFVAWARWNLSLLKDDKYEKYRVPYARIVEDGVMPDGGSLSCDVVKYIEDDLTVYTFQIGMNHMLPLFVIDGDVQHYVRRRYIKSEPENELKSLFTHGTPLSKAIEAFNESCKRTDPGQPSLTEKEVVAALRNLQFKNWIDRPAAMSNELAAVIQTIANDRVLPDSAKFELNTDFDSNDGIEYKIWRPSIRIITEDDSRVFPLRTQFISSSK